MIYATAIDGWSDRLAESLASTGVPVIGVDPYDGSDAAAPGVAWIRDAWLFAWRADGRVAVVQMPGEQMLAEATIRRWSAATTQPQLEPHVPMACVESPGRSRPWPDSRFDEGGNVLASPPTPDQPVGRIIVGRDMDESFKRFLRTRCKRQSGSGLIELDTGWLKVGHVDELVAFLPSAGRMLRAAAPDAMAGLELIKSADPQRAMFYGPGSREISGCVTAAGPRFIEDGNADFSVGRWGFVRITSGKGAGQVARVRSVQGRRLIIDHVWDTRDAWAGTAQPSPTRPVTAARLGRCEQMPIWLDVPDNTSRYLAVETSQKWLDGGGDEFPAVISAGELAGDAELAAAGRRCHQRIFGPGGVMETLQAELGPGIEIVPLPALLADCGDGTGGWWLSPNPVNLLPVSRSAVMLTPFGPRADPDNDGSDVLATAIGRAIRSAGAEPIFVDGWDALHRLDGGAHCGTNELGSRAKVYQERSSLHDYRSSDRDQDG